MSNLPHVTYPGRQVWVGLMITGVMFLITGFAAWFMFLGVGLFLSFLEVSRHMHRVGAHTLQFFDSDFFVIVGYGAVFFFAAMGVARSRWSCRPGMAALVAYAAYLMVYIPFVDLTRGPFLDVVGLFVPLVTAPLGGLVGERIFAKDGR
jgi:hypothetical protein